MTVSPTVVPHPGSTAEDGVGSPALDADLRRVLQGRGRFVADGHDASTLHAVFVRARVAHARIIRLDVAAARRMPGVVAVVTSSDLAGDVRPIRMALPIEGVRPIAFECLASDRVRFHGEPVAVVVARTRALAEDARDAVRVEFEPLPAVTDVDAALAPDAPQVHDDVPGNLVYAGSFRYGDPEDAFASAATVVRECFVQSRVTNAPMETRGGVASWEGDAGGLVYTVATQTPHALRMLLGDLLDLPVVRVRVLSDDIGGSFGQKSGVRAEDLALCAVARLLGTRVAWTEDRRENLEVAGQGRDERIAVEAAVDADGVLVGLRARLDLDHGAHPVVPSAVGAAVHGMVRVLLPGPYRIRGYEFEARVACTNKAPYNAYRGPWQVETWVRERLVDVAARAVGQDPIIFRRRNFADPHATTVTGAALGGTTLADTYDEVLARVDVPAFRREQQAARRDGRWIGLGLAALLEPAPGPPAFRAAIGFPLRPERVRVRLELDGGLVVYTGQSPHGQAHRTTLGQVAATALGIPRSRVRVVTGDTSVTPVSLAGTGGSRSAAMAGGAVVDAVGHLVAHLHELAAEWLGVPVEDVVRDARGFGAGTGRVSLEELARGAHLGAPGLPGNAADGLEVHGSCDGSRGGWAQGTHACWVEVDLSTGRIHVPRYLVVADCGIVVNPAVVEGQVRGGVAQGIGSVLFERVVHDDDGTPLTSTFADYLLPTVGDLPEVEVVHLHGTPSGPADFRGVGEGGAIAAPAALTNAIEDALAPLGVRVADQHLPPSRVLELAGVIGPA